MTVTHQSTRHKICILGNHSGRNAGDNALLEALLSDVSARYPTAEFHIPTINPRFVAETYHRFPVNPVSLLPWHGSIKMLGLPTLHAALSSHLILVTDAILFDRHFWNPVHNYLHTLSYLLPYAASQGKHVVLYNSHLGPLSTRIGRRALTRLLQSCTMIILRDDDSLLLLNELGSGKANIHLGADCALNVQPSNATRVSEIAHRERIPLNARQLLTITLSAYLRTVTRKTTVNRRHFIYATAHMIDTLIEILDVDILMIASQYMDTSINQRVINRMKHCHRCRLISVRHYSHNDIAGLLQHSEMHVSMRTHPMIFAAALGVPVVSIDANPKNVSFLRSIGQDSRRISIHDNIMRGDAASCIINHWRERNTIRRELAGVIPCERRKARRSASHLDAVLLSTRPEEVPRDMSQVTPS